MYAKKIWKWFWNPEIMTFFALQPVIIKCIFCALYWTRCQWPSVSKKQFTFFFKFCIIFLLILSQYDPKFAGYDRLLDNDNIMFGFCSAFTSFWHTFENDRWLLKNLFFSCVAKTCKISAKPNNICILWSQMSLLVFFKSYWRRINRKIMQNLKKIWFFF
jgi:hypothetical protein